MQTSLFDINPNDNHDLVKELTREVKRLEDLLKDFEGKDCKATKQYTNRIHVIIDGMKNSINTGEDLLHIPEKQVFEQFLNKMSKIAARIKLQTEVDAMELILAEKIDKRRREKDEYFRAFGDLSNPFNSVEDIPGVDINKHMEQCIKVGIDFSPAVFMAEDARKKMNALNVFDSSQLHKLNGIPNPPTTNSGTIMALAKDIYMELRNDMRSDPEWRASRIIKNSKQIGVNIDMVRPENISATRLKI